MIEAGILVDEVKHIMKSFWGQVEIWGSGQSNSIELVLLILSEILEENTIGVKT